MDFGSARPFSIFILMIQRLASARLADNSMSDDSSGGGPGSRQNRKNKQAQNKQPVVAGARQPVAEAEVQIFCRGVEFHPLSRGIIRPRTTPVVAEQHSHPFVAGLHVRCCCTG